MRGCCYPVQLWGVGWGGINAFCTNPNRQLKQDTIQPNAGDYVPKEKIKIKINK